MRIAISCFILLIIFGSCSLSYAQTEPMLEQMLRNMETMSKRISLLESEVAELRAQNKYEVQQGSKLAAAADQQGGMPQFFKGLPWGIEFNAAVYLAGQAAFNANEADQKATNKTGGQYALHFLFRKEFTENSTGFVHVESGDGLALHEDLELFSGVNNDMDYTDNRLEVAEMWYEHKFFDKQLIVKGGKLDTTLYVDQSSIAGSYNKHFLSEIFFRASTIDFPGGDKRSPGITAIIQPKGQDWYQIEMQLANGMGSWDNLLDHYFGTIQFSMQPNIFGYKKGKYRIYGWGRSAEYREWSDPGKKAAQKFGFGIDTLQSITDWMDFTLRYGWADPNLYDSSRTTLNGRQFSLEHTISGGFQFRGKPWNREHDHIGVALGVDIPSKDYKDATGRKAREEGHAEVYYSYFVNPYIRISPDFQVIWNPFGDDVIRQTQDRDDIITVIGIRSEMAF